MTDPNRPAAPTATLAPVTPPLGLIVRDLLLLGLGIGLAIAGSHVFAVVALASWALLTAVVARDTVVAHRRRNTHKQRLESLGVTVL